MVALSGRSLKWESLYSEDILLFQTEHHMPRSQTDQNSRLRTWEIDNQPPRKWQAEVGNNTLQLPIHQLCWLLRLVWLTTVVPLNTCILVSVLRTAPKHPPLSNRCPSNISNWIRLLTLAEKCWRTWMISFAFLQNAQMISLLRWLDEYCLI